MAPWVSYSMRAWRSARSRRPGVEWGWRIGEPVAPLPASPRRRGEGSDFVFDAGVALGAADAVGGWHGPTTAFARVPEHGEARELGRGTRLFGALRVGYGDR
jgi:hypothetical protein